MKTKKEKKVETKASRIINIVIMAIEIAVIIACIVLSTTVIVGSKTTTDSLGRGVNITVVLSESMHGNVKDQYDIDSFSAGDLLIIKALSDEEKTSLQVGDVVTYTALVEGKIQLVTHRIINIRENEYYEEGSELPQYYYDTKGDAEVEGLYKTYQCGDIIGLVKGVVPKVGYVINWFQQPTNFLWSVVIPLALLLAYNIYLFIKMLINAKIKRVEEKSKRELEEVKASIKKELLVNGDSQLDEEEIKRKAIEEYIAQMKQQSSSEDKIEDK